MEGELKRNFHVFCWCMKLAWDMSKKSADWVDYGLFSCCVASDVIFIMAERYYQYHFRISADRDRKLCRCNRSNFGVRSNSCIDWIIKPDQYRIYVSCSL